MKNCLLCLENPPDKTGSHIVPHFLIKRIDNESGVKDRDKELGFIVTEDSTESYFGRSIQPEKLEEIYGEVTEDIINNNQIDGIVDNYFCSKCEMLLAVIENAYSSTIDISSKENENYISFKQPSVGFLFWISIIWRLSIHKNNGFRLKPKEENKLRLILVKYLSNDVSNILLDSNDEVLLDIGYKLIRAINYSCNNGTWMQWSTIYQRPYSIMIDEFIIFLYFKKNYLKGMRQDFYGAEPFKIKAKFNVPFESEITYSISHKDYHQIISNFLRLTVVKRIDNLDKKLDLLHQKLGGKGKQMYPQFKAEILRRIAENDAELGKKHTTENYQKIITETLIELNNTSANKGYK